MCNVQTAQLIVSRDRFKGDSIGNSFTFLIEKTAELIKNYEGGLGLLVNISEIVLFLPVTNFLKAYSLLILKYEGHDFVSEQFAKLPL